MTTIGYHWLLSARNQWLPILLLVKNWSFGLSFAETINKLPDSLPITNTVYIRYGFLSNLQQTGTPFHQVWNLLELWAPQVEEAVYDALAQSSPQLNDDAANHQETNQSYGWYWW